MSAQVLIIGVGNEFRGDDAVGLLVARRAQSRLPRAAVLEASGEGAALMQTWAGRENVILIDAVYSGGPAGTVYRFAAATEKIPTKFFHYSTHAFSVAEAIEMARALGQLPPRLMLYGIEGGNFEAGARLSPEVERAAGEVLERVLQDARATG